MESKYVIQHNKNKIFQNSCKAHLTNFNERSTQLVKPEKLETNSK